jgi:parallel beta-helix repeat protein
LVADVTGTISESGAGPAIIDAAFGQSRPATAAITLSGIPESNAVVIDGFTLRNGTRAGIAIDDSPGTIIENCTFESNPGDGVRFTGSDASLLFNNLLYNNSGAGVRALGTSDLWVFNNTIYNNTGTGISIGSDQDASDASPSALVENNIINSNSSFGVAVAANSTGSYTGDYNLNSDGYATGTPRGPHDLTSNVSAMSLFISPTLDPPDLHLAPGSPAVDAGDPATPASLLSWLQQGTTQSDCTPDPGLVDLGYHYPTTDPSCPGPTPTPRVAPTKKKATPTP